MIQCKEVPEYLVDSQNMEFVYTGILHMIDNLESFKKWTSLCDKRDSKFNHDATQNIDEEISTLRYLALDMYEKSMCHGIKTKEYTWKREQ